MDPGITTFADVAGPGVSPGQRLREGVEGAVLAEQVGWSDDGVGEHHRADTIVALTRAVGLQRFELHAARVGHAGTGRSIALVGTQVAPLVEERMAA